MNDAEIQEAKETLRKLTSGSALASLPIQSLLRLCVAQQRQIDRLEERISETIGMGE